MPTDLLETLANDPEDLASWSVYSDLLQTNSDPRGELLSLMLDRERQPNTRLFELQRRVLEKHREKLVPEILADQIDSLVWRRGFIHAVRVNHPDMLAQIAAEPSLRLIAGGELVIANGTTEEWAMAIRAARLPWRHLQIQFGDGGGDLLEPWIAGFTQLESLRISRGDGVDLRGVRAQHLARLAILSAGEVTFGDAEMPRLRELRLLGRAFVGDPQSRAWKQLERIVVANEIDDARAEVLETPWRDFDTESNAYFVTGREIDVALVRKLAGRMTGNVSARICQVPASPRPLTIVQLYGSTTFDLPYDLASAIESLAPSPLPIALVELSEGEGRFLLLGAMPLRGTLPTSEAVLRRAIDLAIGCDPGPEIQDLIDEALALAPYVMLNGSGATRPILNFIDPQVTPLIDLEEYDDYDEDEPEEEDWEDEWDEALVPVEEAPVLTVEVQVEELEAVDDEEVLEEIESDEMVAFERPGEWLEYRDNWDDRAIDLDNAPDEFLIPPTEEDLEIAAQQPDHQHALPTCVRHDRVMWGCQSCDEPYCPECHPDPANEELCSACGAGPQELDIELLRRNLDGAVGEGVEHRRQVR
ncbi:MAG: hypothetical protein QM831_21110 [Kofleriaceae bacterium]